MSEGIASSWHYGEDNRAYEGKEEQDQVSSARPWKQSYDMISSITSFIGYITELTLAKTMLHRNRKLEISTAPTKAKSWEPAYSQALKKKSIGSRSDPESQAGRQSDSYGRWCLELRQEGR